MVTGIIVAAAWVAIAIPVSVVVGRAIAHRRRQAQAAERESDERRS